jgi:hypothetical protein
MGCGCGGANNVYKTPDEASSTSDGRIRHQGAAPGGVPKVWNGPPPKLAAK